MKALTWILSAAILSTLLAYTMVKEKHPTCSVPQLSQVLR